MRGQKGYLSSDSAEHTIYQEIGHALYDPPDNFMAQVHQDLAREKVSMQIFGRREICAAATFSSRCASDDVPGRGTMTGERG